ncbi:MAG TPA: phosphatidylglycerol lysyltransferase domain-containing protein [Smithella sp.]|nr:phosphatidylglycerol lysyltransferase domain-containing protein [Smithella sp.]
MDTIEPVDLKHRDCLTAHFHQMNLQISDYTFANVYLFRNISHYEFLTKECGLFISGRNKQKQHYVMPLNDPHGCDFQTFKDLLAEQKFFFPIPREWLSFFPEHQFIISCDDSDSDYLYLTENMAGFKGKQYVRHRNHLNQFLSLYTPEGKPISANNSQDAASVLKEWQDNSKLTSDKTDFEQCSEALQKFSGLALWGTIYYIDREPAGFIIGEALNTDTFCLHFAKASTKYHGIYEFMFNDTAKRLKSQYKYLNLEEDMGDKNLRRTKSSYGPELLLKKYRICIR